eukprot:TRINITY_DN5495_c0_g1_i1.p1 TRINITY_DN5495_c0_g1~~TRINITY_DN5495_c0_g1_i1.p1  ORF type:complete len:165 (-),score=18.29 TRINITY_DN5495_c0_g1_i1:54-548(-)
MFLIYLRRKYLLPVGENVCVQRTLRPLALRRFNTLMPSVVLIRERNPWTRARFNRLADCLVQDCEWRPPARTTNEKPRPTGKPQPALGERSAEPDSSLAELARGCAERKEEGETDRDRDCIFCVSWQAWRDLLDTDPKACGAAGKKQREDIAATMVKVHPAALT